MTEEIKKIYEIKNEKMIDYQTIRTRYLLILAFYLKYETNIKELEQAVLGFKIIHSIFYPEYDNTKIDNEDLDYFDLLSYETIKKINTKIDDLNKLKISENIEENIKRDHYVRTRKITKKIRGDKMELKNLKGTDDFMPNDQIVRNKIIDKLKANFEKYGYMPLETPILNYYDLLALKYDEKDEILNEIYRLTDQGNRDIGLRYDLTVPFCKVVSMQKELRLPFRRYEIGKVFRNGPVKLGRTREFYQCDVDVVGIEGRLIEAEQIIMAIEIFKSLGIDINILYNNRKLMNGLLIEAGIENPTFAVIGILDKLDKVDKKTIYEMFENESISSNIVDNIFTIFGKSLEDYNEKYKNTTNQLLKEGLEELNEVTNYLKKLNYQDNIQFDSYLSRGLEIYTGIVFEFRDKLKRLNGSLGAGGRYDKIITNFINDGNEYPAVGLSFGLEPIYVILKNEAKKEMIDYYIIPMDTETESLQLAQKIRNKNKKVLIEMNKRKIKKSFDYANKENIPYVIVLGENEIKENKITIKNMKESTQETLEVEEFLRRI